MVELQLTEKAVLELRQASSDALGTDLANIQLAPFTLVKGIADETIKIMVKDGRGRPIAVIMWSCAMAPNMVARGAARARVAREALGSDFGNVVLMPLLEGVLEGRSFAVMPIMTPLSTQRFIGRIHRRRIAPSVLHWLQGATAKTSRELLAEERMTCFGQPLAYLSSIEAVPEGLRSQATIALQRLSDGEWLPRAVLMHGDLWVGNILIDPRRKDRPWNKRFVIIDWAGAVVEGFAIYDLIRIAISLRLPHGRFLSELFRHAEILCCDTRDTMSYLLAALGYIGSHLEHFPLERFVQMSVKCTHYLEDSIK